MVTDNCSACDSLPCKCPSLRAAESVLDLLATLAVYAHGVIGYGWESYQRRTKDT